MEEDRLLLVTVVVGCPFPPRRNHLGRVGEPPLPTGCNAKCDQQRSLVCKGDKGEATGGFENIVPLRIS